MLPPDTVGFIVTMCPVTKNPEQTPPVAQLGVGVEHVPVADS
jgi:hypothetical protein